jgi:lipopolysaccharide/colanic/teichoic acid biosynthesis glycosyltransferase
MKPGKRLLDVLVAAGGLLVLSPLFAAVALAIWAADRGPVFYLQERVGLGGQTFGLWKFRSMRAGADRQGPLVTVGGDPRVTRIGRWLRRFKIDELPQLLNVLKREMSLVGPRPEVPRYVALYSLEQRAVLRLAPGITDPASIEFSHEEEILRKAEDPERHYVEVVMPRKIALNLEYGRRATVWTDLGVIVGTLRVILRSKP